MNTCGTLHDEPQRDSFRYRNSQSKHSTQNMIHHEQENKKALPTHHKWKDVLTLRHDDDGVWRHAE